MNVTTFFFINFIQCIKFIYLFSLSLTITTLSFHSKLYSCSVRHACETKPYWDLSASCPNQLRSLLHEA